MASTICGGVGAERGVVEAGGDRDADLLAVQHFLSQRDCGAGQRPAVRDDDESDGHGAHPPAANAVAAAAINIAADVAPGSW